ncbi:MAG: hypothetical protein LBG27_02290 [Spirochaetaceae bacterium]|nr:hypothetical protein [Spirochaetaceae bacterium]
MRKKNICSGLIGIVLVMGFVLAGCGTGPATPKLPKLPASPEEPSELSALPALPRSSVLPGFDTKAEGNGVVITGHKRKGGDVAILRL